MASTSLVIVNDYLTKPTKGVSSLFAVLFVISGVLHIIQNSKIKSWRLLWLLPCASIIFTAGFICSEYNASQPPNSNNFAPSVALIFSGVPVLLACLYLVLLHLVATQPDPPKCLRSFIWCILTMLVSTIISLTAQATATLFNPSASPGTIRSDLAILQASLVLLLSSNICLLVILAWFHRRCFKAKLFPWNRNIKVLIFTLYASATLILARNMFRTVQVFCTSHSPAWRIETLFWVFEAVPLLVCMLLLSVLHPGELISGKAETAPCIG